MLSRILASLSIALLLCIFQLGSGFLSQPLLHRSVKSRENAELKQSLLRLHFFGRKSGDKADNASNDKSLNSNKKQGSSPNAQPPKNGTDLSPWQLFSFVRNVSWPSVASGTIGGALITSYVLFSTFSFIMPDQMQMFDPSVSNSISEPVTLFEDILVDLEKDYVDPIDPRKLFKTGMKAMLRSLDPYTEYEDLKAARNLQESVSGKYGGVGLVIANRKEDKSFIKTTFYRENTFPTDDKSVNINNIPIPKAGSSNGVTIVDAFEGYAYNGGLRPGDRILKVDNIDCTEKNVEFVRDLLRGGPDTEVTVTYARDEYMDPKLLALTKKASSGQEEKTAVIRETILRRQLVKLSDIRLATLLGKPEDGIGYINLSGFNAGAGKDFRNALLMLRYSSPNDLNGLVLDLRGNPGGLLDAAVEIASYLVPEKSDIVSAKSKNGQEIVYRSVIAPIRPEKMKLVVIVNKGSASASEIVSGAIQDLDAGIIIGPSTTYGKGLVQKIIPLPFDAALKYTIARYYTPSGRCIQAVRYTGGRETLLASSSASQSKESLAEEEKKKSTTPPLKILREQDTSSSLPLPLPLPLSRTTDTSLLALAATADTGSGGDNKPPRQQQPEPQEEEEEDESTSPILNPNKAANGIEIPDNERNIFYTLLNHRPVRDGGGIEPDLTVPPLKIGPAEGVLYTEGVYADFAEDYLLHHNIRPAIKRAALRERISRDMDPRYQGANFGVTIGQFFVVNHDINAEKFRQFQFKTPQERDLFLSQHAGDVFGFEVDSQELKQELREEIDEIDTYKSSAFDFLANSNNLNLDRNKGKTRLTPSSISSSPPAITANTVGTNSQVPQKFFWGEAYTPQLEDKLFNEFRTYITTRIDSGELQWERIFSGPLTKLEKRLKDAGFSSVLPELNKLKPQLKAAFLKDLENNRRFILDGLELALMNHELPGRLITYHTVIQDPQIATAMKLMRGEALPSTTVDTAKTGVKKQVVEVDPPSSAAEVTSSNIATSTVTYEQLLGKSSSFPAATANEDSEGK